jgi:hypothetical protein
MLNVKRGLWIFLIALMILPSFVFAQSLDLDLERKARLSYAHVIEIKEFSSNPQELLPGQEVEMKIVVQNIGDENVKDIRFRLNYPEGISPYNDIDFKKILTMAPGQIKEVTFKAIVSPDALEGIYELPLTLEYLNFIGDERSEEVKTSFLVRETPMPFVEVKSNDIYKENLIGDLIIKVVNDKTANIRFLTIEVGESEQYDLLDYKKEYIGDLDSDDFQEVSFKLKVDSNEKGISPDTINLPITLKYTDSFNKEYVMNLDVPFKIRTAGELGKNKSYTLYLVILLLIILWIVYGFYSRYKKRKLRQMKN